MNEAGDEHVGLLSSDEGGGSSDERDSSEDEVTSHVPPPDMAAARAQVPTISVTAHSPGVLEDSLQQLRRLHHAVQRMRAAPPTAPSINGSSSRLSTSCPSLSKENAPEVECASPVHLDLYPSRKGSGESQQWWECGEGRRRSWAALEPSHTDAARTERGDLNGHSASLSSMESEGEVIRTARHSAHSLNDTELAKDFEKVTSALRGARGPGTSLGALGARLSLHKSVSTPSIVAAVAPAVPPQQNILTRSAGDSDSVSDDESHPPATLQTKAAFDHHSEKRRKRGSLFFRKKKDKSRPAAHCWSSATGGTHCDWCSRPLDDKPALHCDSCSMTVHQNVCKDYIVECHKSKSSKNSVGKSLSASSGKSSKRSSVSNQSHSNSTTHLLNDDKDASDHKHDHSNASDDSGLSEWPEANLTADMLGDEATALGLGAIEPETWAAGAPKGLAKSLGERETKRQEHIYELILTEKHHCLTIRLMQKMFAEGLTRACGVPPARVSRMFPCADELWRVHCTLLSKLRNKQRVEPRTDTVADVLADTFSCRTPLATIYGEFCARHRDAVEVFKETCNREPRVARFIRRCQQNPLLRKKGVPECVLFVAQRLTKYPLLIEPLLKTANDDHEKELLQRALQGVKEILVDVDNQVAAKEREDRKLEIYHRIDAKSFAHFRGRKFKKSDILQGNRGLKFEGVATLMQGRSKMQTIMVIVLTDVLFFLHDNNNKYTFFTPDNKTGVVSLTRLLVREKAGAEAKGLYIISSNAAPEMFELRVHRPKDTSTWIHQIRAAVAECPETSEECEATALASAEERQRQLEARHENIRLITESLRAKDREHASILEEKMALHMKLVAHTGTTNLDIPNTAVSVVFPGGLQFPEYVRLSAPSPDTHALWQHLCRVVTEALETSSVCWGAGGSLGRSTSSAGEKHSSQYVNIALPKRADTFAGFDAKRVNHRTSSETGDPEPETTNNNVSEQEKPFYEQNGEAALKLQHAIYTLTCIAWQQLTTIHSLQAQVCAWRSCGNNALASRSHDAQLEELRAAQAKLTADRAQWEARRQAKLADIAKEREEIEAAKQELAEQQKDLVEQRDRLYRRLQMLHTQGGSQEEIASVGTLSPDSSASDNTRRKETKWRSSRGSTGSETGVVPPPQLLSARNESKAAARAIAPPFSMVKQQLPLKLASGKSQPAPHGYHRLHESPNDGGLLISHGRAGSSPAPLPTQPPTAKAARTNTYPKLPEKFRVRSPETPNTNSNNSSNVAPSNNIAQSNVSTSNAPAEEEVIYF